jgi:phosphotriesterase-related protein
MQGILTTRREFLVQTAAVSVLAVSPGRIVHASKAKAGFVQTVLGPLDASKLGFTLTHEHASSNSPKSPADRAGSVARRVDKLKAARDAGIDTLVDVTTFDVGRDIRLLEEVSRKSGMQIVACTGQHLYAPEALNVRTVEQITELFVREIEQGIDGTDIKAGVIKVASRSDAMTPAEEKVFRAAARASKATGIPVETHTHGRRRGGEAQAQVFEAEGLSPARVSLGHSDDTDDVNYLIGLAKRGYTVGMDHIYRGMAQGEKVPWQSRANYIKQLIDAGFTDRVVLSNDWVFGDVEREALNPDGMLFNTRKTIPYLKQIGVSQQQIDAMTVENPKRFFARGR